MRSSPSPGAAARWSAGADERMSLPSDRELDRAERRQIGDADRLRVDGDGAVVDACAALLDEAAGLALRRREPAARQQLEGGDAPFELAARHLDRRQFVAGAAFRENAPGGVGGCFRRGAAVTKRGRLG